MDSKTVLGVLLMGLTAFFAGSLVSLASGSAGALVLASQVIGGLASGFLAFFLLVESPDSNPPTEVRDTFTYKDNE